MSVVPDAKEPNVRGDLTPSAEVLERARVTGTPGLRASVYAITAALVAGFLAWGIGEITCDYYRPSAKAQQSARDFTALNREKAIADQKNTAIAYGTFGAVLGLFSGVAGGASRRSIPGGACAAMVGLMLGGIGTVVVSYRLAPIFARYYSDETGSLILSFLVRGGIGAIVGMTAGLALGWGWRGTLAVPRELVGGLAGGVCGAIAFEVVNAVVFPADRNDAVIPSSMQARLLAYVIVSVAVALGAVLFGRHRSLSEARTPQAQS
jgi:hypothetical protein